MSDERTIDGVAPERWARPQTPEEVTEVLREAELSGNWVLPVGGGTAMAAARPVTSVPVALDMTSIAGIREYEPTDLTISVAAGTRWVDLQASLRVHGQEIPIDVPFPDRATVGGVVATGYAGPRRLRDGTLKDLLLGASFVRGDGLVGNAGGMVVKNVSGFEIPRLLHGSWGSLAVISSVNLKVLPRPEFETTLITDAMDTLDAAERVLNLTRAQPAVAAATIDGTLDQATAAVRLTGREQPTRDLAAELKASDELACTSESVNREASTVWWQEREDHLAAGDDGQVAIEVGGQPSDTLQALRALGNALPDAAGIELHASPGIGAIGLAFDASLMSLGAWARVWSEHGFDASARFVIAAAPRDWRAERDVWFIPPAQRKLMTALKGTFDPHDTLNRGRLWTAPQLAQS